MNRLKALWCELFHGGGHIKRDSQGRINWQCQKCGRWADPVPLEQEQRMTTQAIEAAHGIKEKNT